jgi:histidinol-phosphatase (PHP family)
MWFNFHTHSNFCDGKGTAEEYFDSATQKNFISLGFSSHAPLPFDCKWCMPPSKLQDYYTAIADLKKKHSSPEVYKSLEIDFIPNVISPDDFKADLDYTVGSIHFTDAFADGTHWEIDGPHLPFLDGLAQIFNNNMKHAMTRYFELTRQMVAESGPTIVGHLDKMKIQNKEDKFFKESDSWYIAEVEKTLDEIEKTGSIVEVNTRGLYQKKSTTTYPSPWILELIHERNIPITLSSDAHHPDDLVNQFEETVIALKKIGFKKISVLQKGEWKASDFNSHGIIAGH